MPSDSGDIGSVTFKGLGWLSVLGLHVVEKDVPVASGCNISFIGRNGESVHLLCSHIRKMSSRGKIKRP